MNKELDSLCYFVKDHWDIWHLEFPLYWMLSPVRLGTVYKIMMYYERNEKRSKITVLVCKASKRCWNPLSPIALDPRSSVLTVLKKRMATSLWRNRNKINFTMVLRRPSAKYCIPSSEIKQPEMLSELNIYGKKFRFKLRENNVHYLIL